MSSDNYFLIRRVGGRFAVSMEFASDANVFDQVPPCLSGSTPIDSPRIIWFDDLNLARDYTFGEYTEHGVVEDLTWDHWEDTLARRYLKAARLLSWDFDLVGISYNGDGSVRLDLNNGLKVEISSSQNVVADIDNLLAWFEATTPQALLEVLAPTLPD